MGQSTHFTPVRPKRPRRAKQQKAAAAEPAATSGESDRTDSDTDTVPQRKRVTTEQPTPAPLEQAASPLDALATPTHTLSAAPLAVAAAPAPTHPPPTAPTASNNAVQTPPTAPLTSAQLAHPDRVALMTSPPAAQQLQPQRQHSQQQQQERSRATEKGDTQNQRNNSAATRQRPANQSPAGHQRLSGDSSATRQRLANHSPATAQQPASNSSVAAAESAASQQRQRGRKGKAAPPSGAGIARCGTRAESLTSHRPHRPVRRAGAAQSPRMARPASPGRQQQPLGHRSHTPPQQPAHHRTEPYHDHSCKYSSATELTDGLHRRQASDEQAAAPTSSHALIKAEQAGVEQLATHLAAHAGGLVKATGDTATLDKWLDLLTPLTRSMNRPLTPQSTEAERQAYRTRCVLRLDFPSSLACAAAYTHLQSLAVETSKSPVEDNPSRMIAHSASIPPPPRRSYSDRLHSRPHQPRRAHGVQQPRRAAR